MGLDIKRFLETAQPMQRACGPDVPPAENRACNSVSPWVLQPRVFSLRTRSRSLRRRESPISELGWNSFWRKARASTGAIPLADEPVTTADHYGNDRFFAYLELEGQQDALQRQAVAALEASWPSVARIRVKDIWAHRPGILPLGDSDRRWRDHWH